MTLLEPLMLGALISYIMTPIATYALGFDPSLSWQYVLAFGALPLVLACPAILHAACLFEVLSGGFFRYEGLADLAERAGLVAIVGAISLATYFGISHWIHAPVTVADTIRLAVASPFIGGIAAVLVVVAACLVAAPFLKQPPATA